jgi:predicted ABC-type transport system involved in lysophospholipase L1 biosynthesis ATPase subunit
MSEQQSAIIVAQGLRKQFGSTPVLRDLALSIAPGTLFGLFGPSRSGKSTWLHLCCGHLRPDGGTLRVLGAVGQLRLVATSERQAVQLSLLAVVFFSGFTLPLDALRQPALAIACALPATYGTMLLQDTMLRGTADVPAAYAALVALAVGMCAVCLGLLHWQLKAR